MQHRISALIYKGKLHFSLPFPTYFTLEIKSEFGTTRAERSVEENFLNEHPILIK